MRTRNAGMALLLLSAVWAVPAAAMLKGAVGTTHDMCTDDLSRTLHDQRHMSRSTDSSLTSDQIQSLQEAARVHDTIIASHMGMTGTGLAHLEGQLEGKQVFGSQGQELGTVIAVDYGSQLAQVYMADEGMSVALPMHMLTLDGNQVMASTVSKADTLAMVNTQARVMQFAGL